MWIVAGLVVANSVPDHAVETMRAEVDRIWNQVGVRVRWLLPGPPIDAIPEMIVIVSDTVPCRTPETSEPAGSDRHTPRRERTLGCIQRDGSPALRRSSGSFRNARAVWLNGSRFDSARVVEVLARRPCGDAPRPRTGP
jgi:hypothetical protein